MKVNTSVGGVPRWWAEYGVGGPGFGRGGGASDRFGCPRSRGAVLTSGWWARVVGSGSSEFAAGSQVVAYYGGTEAVGVGGQDSAAGASGE